MLLKRQREPSPASEYRIPFDLPDQTPKRVRHMGPSAWEARAAHQYDPHYIDDTEDDDDGDEVIEEPDTHQPLQRSPTEYSSINSLLQSLHSEHAHKPPLLPSNTHSSHCLAAPHYPTPAHYPSSSPSSPPSSTLLHPHARGPAVPEHVPYIEKEAGVKAEMESVRSRYEETNRMLGSLFLERRRLAVSDPNIPQSDP
ncbi:hypothetical protein BOTBODRAFT_183886 [Botryobasidium botryosum FD-172 SS1]|uniref:Uncharacterized protein n=1 Tax=Botryobasidium botryosum (strain FD-172 SS1) TaxID=930990 RepID=A0A067N6Y3_BOTB1|nr:hypothetical protein BOTBODRAFT_183886 [Botryobasidium botryosum FD-172 SS1]